MASLYVTMLSEILLFVVSTLLVVPVTVILPGGCKFTVYSSASTSRYSIYAEYSFSFGS